ncbi:unnamed protein product [Polarella glacialis]|uniref:Uncharacterized protein n=1 Tax=Polarella glacialis TaxID=89957 RepID=A0A813G4R3_POLGL|nr:unnamed protein product [Polarella glacialis]
MPTCTGCGADKPNADFMKKQAQKERAGNAGVCIACQGGGASAGASGGGYVEYFESNSSVVCKMLTPEERTYTVVQLTRTSPQSVDMQCAVMDGDVLQTSDHVLALGVRTCACIIVETTHNVIGWHASAWNREGLPKASEMPKILSLFEEVGANFIRGFVVPGSDLSQDLRVRAGSDAAKLLPVGCNSLANLVSSVAKTLPWWKSMVTTEPVPWTDVVEYTRGSHAPFVYKNSSAVRSPGRQESTSSAASQPDLITQVERRSAGGAGMGLFSKRSVKSSDTILAEFPLIFHQTPSEKNAKVALPKAAAFDADALHRSATPVSVLRYV